MSQKMKNNQKPEKASLKGLARLLSYLGKYWLELVIVVVGVFVSAIYQVKALNELQPIIDQAILPKDLSKLDEMAKVMAGYYLASVIATFIYARLMVRIGEKSIRDIRNDLFTKIQTLPVSFFDENEYGDIMSRFTNDTDTLSQVLSESIPTVIRSLIVFFSTFTMLFRQSLDLTIVVIIGLLVIFFFSKRIINKSALLFKKSQQELGLLMGFEEEMFSGQKVIKVFNREEETVREFEDKSEEVRKYFTEANVVSGKLAPFQVHMVNILYALISVIGVSLTISSKISPGILAAYLSNLRNVQNPIMNISQQVTGVFSALAGASRIFKVMDMDEEEDEGYIDFVNARVNRDGSIEESQDLTGKFAWRWHEDGVEKFKLLEGRIDFEHVDFSYNGVDKILKDVTFYANPGEKLALVGSTGAGKTTITNVITRYYDIDSGSIKVDGIDIRNIKKDALRRAFGMVLQDVNLFTETITENIRYGNLAASDAEVQAAARITSAGEFIDRLPDGYDTVIKGDGSSLSNGENQLISIARVAVEESPMLILDEATSSIDTNTEIKVTDAMDTIMLGSTSIVIAHRLSTIRNSDVIMVMDHGRIIERGNHDELMDKHGVYYQLYTGELELD